MKTWIFAAFLAVPLASAPAQEAAKLDADARKAFEAMAAFSTAPTWEAAAKHVLDAAKLKSRMEAHYRHFTWKPLAILRWEHRGAIKIGGDTAYNTHSFELYVTTLNSPLSVSLVQVGSGYKIDWELFAQFHDRSFEHFLRLPDSPPLTFRLNLVKGVALDSDKKLPLLGEPIRLRAAWYPTIGYPGNIYAGSESDVGKKAKTLVGWTDGKPFRATVKLAKSGDASFVELVGLEPLDLSSPSVFAE